MEVEGDAEKDHLCLPLKIFQTREIESHRSSETEVTGLHRFSEKGQFSCSSSHRGWQPVLIRQLSYVKRV